jgi:oligogalacturonide transport system permease protein
MAGGTACRRGLLQNYTKVFQIRAGGANMSHTQKRKLWGIAFISPWLVGFSVFQLYPLLASLYYSMTDLGFLNTPVFIGLKNYIDLLTKDGDFFQSIKVTLWYAFFSVPVKLMFALAVAMLMNMRLKGINLFRAVYYLPSIMGGSVAISLLWRFFFMKEGVVNNLLGKLGIPAISWIGDPDIALYTIGLLIVWQFGSSMVLFLAALRQIPHELLEVARIDGAGRVKVFAHITIPLITPIIFFNFVMQMINAFQQFTSAFVVTNGGPMKATYLMGLKIYTDGFRFFRMGYASASSWLLFAIILVFTALIFRSSSLWVYYNN